MTTTEASADQVEKAGWTGFALGSLVTGTVLAAVVTYGIDEAPVCHEDEVAVASLPGEDYRGGMPSTECIPLDDLVCGPGVRLTKEGCER